MASAAAGSRKQFAFEVLKRAILDGVLPSGASVIEEQVARDLQLSRTPVREALRMLEIVGLITRRPSRGFEVRGFDGHELQQLNQVRILLEGEAVARACTSVGGAKLEEIERALAALEDPRSADAHHYRVAHKEFHRHIYVSAGNPFLLDAIDPLLDLADLAWEATAPDLVRYDLARKGHRRIVSAIRDGDAKAASAALADHILVAEEKMLAALEERKSRSRGSSLRSVAAGMSADPRQPTLEGHERSDA